MMIDDPATTKIESNVDPSGNTILNPGIYIDQVNFSSGSLIMSYSSSDWNSCHSVQAVDNNSAYFLV